MLSDFLKKFDVLTDTEINDFLKLGSIRHLLKGDFFISEGKSCKEVAFIQNGILRSFFTPESGDEITYCITFPGTLMTAYSSFITSLPTLENIQAVSSCELLVVQKADIDQLFQSSINWTRFFKIIAEQQYIELEKRLFLFQKEKAKNDIWIFLKSASVYPANPVTISCLVPGHYPKTLKPSKKRDCFLDKCPVF